ncbi:MAG: AEC family transporter [Clostridia bacterium]|nr:AEC family transporter [Clostridia bacterium]
MRETFILTLSQLAVLFLFIALGYFFARKKLLGEGASKSLANLVVFVFMPALCFRTFANNFTLPVIAQKWSVILIGFLMIGASMVLAALLARVFAKDPAEKPIFAYCFTISNYGYLGYPLIEGVLGEEALFVAMLLSVAMNVYNYTIGYSMLNPTQPKVSLKSLVNPITMFMLAGIAVGLSGLQLPTVVTGAVDMAANCMAPLALFLIGMIVAKVPFKSVFNQPRLYLASAVRLLLIPSVFGVIMYFCGVDGTTLLIATVLLALPLGTNSVVVPEAYGADSSMAAAGCLLSHLLSLITLPIVVGLLRGWLG